MRKSRMLPKRAKNAMEEGEKIKNATEKMLVYSAPTMVFIEGIRKRTMKSNKIE